MTAIARPVTVAAGSGVPPARQGVSRWEQRLLFGISFAILLSLGVWIVVLHHVIYADAQTRLAHAYIALWGLRPRLAAIGFVWPPLQTLVLLPFAVLKPLATSLVALPLFAALCGATLLTVLNRTLALLGLGWGWRYALLIAFAANPLFLDYATNGMAEILYLMLLSCGMHYLVSWHVEGATSYRKLALSGLFMALGFMARYELGLWIALMTAVIVATAWPTRRRASDVEAPVLIFLAPVVYLSIVWGALSMMIVGGGPFAWLTRAGDQAQGARIIHPNPIEQIWSVFLLTARISPLLWVVPLLLLVLAIVRRDRLALGLAVMVLAGAALTAVLVVSNPHVGLLQPRYNIRALPVMLVGAAWVIRAMPTKLKRNLATGLVLAGLLASIPLALNLMQHYPYQYEEQAYARALTTGRDQNGTESVGGYQIGDKSDRLLAAWINKHITRPDSILIDDGAFPGLILFTGRPQLFRTTISRGERQWMQVLAHPWGTVRYMVVSPAFGWAGDKVIERYPDAYKGGMPGTQVLVRDRFGAILKVDSTP